MRKKLGVIAIAAVAVAVVAGAALLYRSLSARLEAQPGEIYETTEQSRTAPDPVPAPDFTVVDADGNEVTLSELFGTPIVLNFWASWCGPCQSEMPEFQKAYDESDPEALRFVMVNLTDGRRETVESAQEFLAQHGYTFPVLYDTTQDAAMAYGVRGIPATVFINADGEAAGYFEGALSELILLEGISLIQ